MSSSFQVYFATRPSFNVQLIVARPSIDLAQTVSWEVLLDSPWLRATASSLR